MSVASRDPHRLRAEALDLRRRRVRVEVDDGRQLDPLAVLLRVDREPRLVRVGLDRRLVVAQGQVHRLKKRRPVGPELEDAARQRRDLGRDPAQVGHLTDGDPQVSGDRTRRDVQHDGPVLPGDRDRIAPDDEHRPLLDAELDRERLPVLERDVHAGVDVLEIFAAVHRVHVRPAERRTGHQDGDPVRLRLIQPKLVGMPVDDVVLVGRLETHRLRPRSGCHVVAGDHARAHRLCARGVELADLHRRRQRGVKGAARRRIRDHRRQEIEMLDREAVGRVHDLRRRPGRGVRACGVRTGSGQNLGVLAGRETDRDNESENRTCRGAAIRHGASPYEGVPHDVTP